jgi:hypothetical protein
MLLVSTAHYMQILYKITIEDIDCLRTQYLLSVFLLELGNL